MWEIVLRRVLPVLGVVAAGAAVLALAGGDAVGIAAGLFLLGAAGVLAISFVFLEIGLAEDRERASGERRRPGRDAAAAPHGPERPGGSHGAPRRRPRRRRPE